MSAVPMSARLRCKHCNHKVPLSREQVRELSGRLRAEVGCPACRQRFSASLLRTPKETAPPPVESMPVPIPVPIGAKQAPPPFRPLPPVHDAANLPPRPLADWQPAAAVPGAAPLPFSPLQTAPAGASQPSGSGGWWKRQSKTTQYLILGLGIVVMGGFAFTMQTLTNQPKPQQQPPPPEATTPTTQPMNSPQNRPTQPTVEPPVPPIDQISPDQLKIADPPPEPTPDSRR